MKEIIHTYDYQNQQSEIKYIWRNNVEGWKKPAIMRKGEYKCRILEMHLKSRNQHVKNSFVYTENAKSKPQGNHKLKIYLRYTDREEIRIWTNH